MSGMVESPRELPDGSLLLSGDSRSEFSMKPLPYDIVEAMIQCFGKCFHYKDAMASFLLAAGVPRGMVEEHREYAKYVWSRKVLTDLSQREDGGLIQRRILKQLVDLRDVADREVPDRDAGIDALRSLKRLSLEKNLIAKAKKKESRDSASVAAERARMVRERAERLDALRRKFNDAVVASDRQRAGYALEEILVALFALFELDYRKSYRTPTQQIDGQFYFEGFHYLVEAKWRSGMPTEQEIAGFKHKVDGKLESTRGLFVSVPGFRPTVVEQFNGRGTNIILLDGSHLTHVLEGRMDLRELLRHSIDRAAQEGVVYTPITG